MSNHPITISGNLTADPYLTRTGNGAFVARMRVATNRPYKAQGSDTQWSYTDQLYIDVDAWGDLAYNCRGSLKRGMPVIVQGVLVTDSWKDPESNQNRSTIRIRARSVGMDLSRHMINSAQSIVTQSVGDNGVEMPVININKELIDKDLTAPPEKQEPDSQFGGYGSPSQSDAVQEENARELVGVGAGATSSSGAAVAEDGEEAPF